jgi:hypothetical protein
METTRIIEHYLDGTLSVEERENLEERSERDPEFNALVSLHKEVNESINDKELHTLKQLLERIDQDYRILPVQSLKSPVRLWMRIAASLIFIIVISIGVKFAFFETVSNDALFEKYYSTYSVDMVSRSMQYDQQLLEKAIMNYSQAHYSQALLQLNEIVQSDQENYQAWFYRGLTCLETQLPAEAIRSFRSIPETWALPYREHRNWYLALALLKNNQNADASVAFKNIMDEGGYYAERAHKIYKKIRK